jgi:uncharacterized integral membrane protein
MADPTRPQSAQAQREGTNWRLWLVGLAVLLLAIVCLQNSQEVEVEILFVETTAPLIAILLIAALIGAAAGYLAPVLRRHRRTERKRDRE